MNTQTSTFKLRPALKAKWLRMLRSGDYLQGRLSLCQETEQGYAYCPLGLLCLATGSGNERLLSRVLPSSDMGLALPAARNWAIRDGVWSARGSLGWASIPWLNDHIGLSFDEIADLIEKFVETEE